MRFDFELELESHRGFIRGFVISRLKKTSLPVDMEADDILQDTLLTAWEKRGTFDPATGKRGLYVWLRQIAEYKICEHLTKQRSRKRTVDVLVANNTDGQDVVSIEDAAIENLMKEEDVGQLYRLIEDCTTLTGYERQAVLLRLQGNLSHEEVAETMGITNEHSRVLYHRATTKLRAKYEQVDIFDLSAERHS